MNTLGPRRLNSPLRLLAAVAFNFAVMYTFLGTLVWLGVIDRVRTDYSFLAWMNILVGVLLSGGTFLVYRFLDRGSPLAFGFRMNRRDGVFAGVTLLLSVIFAIAFIAIIGQDQGLGAEFQLHKLARPSMIGLMMLGLIGWIVAVMQEEVLYRGYFYANLQRLHPLVLILVSAFFFSLTHIPTKGIALIPLIIHFVGGIGYGYVYFKSGSLLLSTLLHGMHNFLLDILFNNDYSVTLVTLAHPLDDSVKLAQQLMLLAAILLITHVFYGRNGAFTPADNLRKMWNTKPEHMYLLQQQPYQAR
ncbi:CAAX amino terminal protease self- immunity [compost metagenome]